MTRRWPVDRIVGVELPGANARVLLSIQSRQSERAQEIAPDFGKFHREHDLLPVGRRVHGHAIVTQRSLGLPDDHVRFAGSVTVDHHIARAHHDHVGHIRTGHGHLGDVGLRC